MHVTDIISLERIKIDPAAGSKKRVLEDISRLFAETTPNLAQGEVFDSLLGRERLGSTGFGKGVAIPHSRLPRLAEPIAAFVKLDRGVDFDSMDNQPVDLLFALLVPEQSTEDHLQLLAQLAQMVSEPDLCHQLRRISDPRGLYDLLRNWEPENISA